MSSLIITNLMGSGEVKMINKKLNFYFFGDVGEYDDYNPAYVCNKEYASEILYLIAKNKPFSINSGEISKVLNLEEAVVIQLINSLQFINAIEARNNGYRVTFPTFLEQDVIDMENYLNDIGEVIGKKVMELKDVLYKKVSKLKCSKYHSYQRILYHVICDKIFDGTAFEFFTKNNTFCSSKIQPGNRDYIIVAYEDSELVESHSNKILCSSNNYRSGGFTFNSFGDSDGLRKDMFRFLRLAQNGVNSSSTFGDLNVAYNKILDSKNKEMVYECGKLICHSISKNIKYSELLSKERNLADFLKELEYIDINESDDILVKVPVFYDFEMDTIIKEISDIILNNIFSEVKNIFESFETNATKLTSVIHLVDMKEVANELWHQIFGATNEYLVKVGFVEVPENIKGQGRYLRSITVTEK